MSDVMSGEHVEILCSQDVAFGGKWFKRFELDDSESFISHEISSLPFFKGDARA